jgi:NUMOD4 motif/HNH endonuclease
MENWEIIGDYPNYSVSNFGNIKNNKTGKILKIYPNHQNYCRVCLCKNGIRKLISLHYLVIKHHTNQEINGEIDHIDRNRLNNNVSNLRIVDRITNCRNTNKRTCYSTSKYKGVSFYKSRNKWIAKITINYKGIHLGCFLNERDAGIAYNNYIINNDLKGFILNDISN